MILIYKLKSYMRNKNKLKFYNNGNLLFESNLSKNINDVTDNRIIGIFKSEINKLKLNECDNWQEYLIKLGYTFKKCNFCGNNATAIIKINRNEYNIDILNLEFRLNYCNNYNKTCHGAKLNPNSVAFVSKVYDLSESDALSYIKTRNKSPFYKENHKSDEDYKKSQARNIEYYINIYGDVNGIKKYNSICEKLKYSHSEQYYIDTLGEIHGKEHWANLSSLKDSMSYEFCLKKCNNDVDAAQKMYNDRLHSVNIGLSRMIERYGIIDGTIAHEKICDNAKLKMKKYFSKCKNNIDNIKFCNSVSKSSISFFDKITEILINEKILDTINESQYGIKNEKPIYNELTQTCYFYDYFIKRYNIIIEYNGVKWHPKSIDDINFKHPYNKINDAEYYYNKDLHKLNTAKKYGYNTIVIWEDDNDKINTCITEIKRIINEGKKI